MMNKSLIKTTSELKRKRRRRRTKRRDYFDDNKMNQNSRINSFPFNFTFKLYLSLAMFNKVLLLTLVLIFFANNSIIIVTSSSSLLPPFPLQTENYYSASPIIHANGFQLYATNEIQNGPQQQHSPSSNNQSDSSEENLSCNAGLLTFELSTGFIYKPSSAETLAMMPSTLQLTDCLDYCLHNSSCLAINFEMGLCVLLSSSAKQNPVNLYSSQFPVFTIYAEKKCLLSGNIQATKQKRKCQRAWTFERVAGYEMKTRPKRKLKLVTKEQCMEACLTERDFECRSANWYRQTGECTLSDQDRHSVSQSEAGDQQIKASLHELYGPSNLTLHSQLVARPSPAPISGGLYQNYYLNAAGLQERSRNSTTDHENTIGDSNETRRIDKPIGERPNSTLLGGFQNKYRSIRQLFSNIERISANKFNSTLKSSTRQSDEFNSSNQDWPLQQYADMPANALVDYLENNCVYEPNKLCEFRKIQNRVLKTVDSIYQDISSLDECKQKCLNAPYRCYSFDYGDTSERVCRTSHLDQASLLSVKEPYLDVVGAITYELASCFNVSIQCRAREMVALVSSSKMFKGKIYVKSRPNSCVNDVKESLQFELSMKYHDEACDVRATSTSQQGVFSNDIVIQHHDRIVTTQDVGLAVYCQYDLGNKSITNNVDLAIERIDELPLESKNQPGRPNNNGLNGENNEVNGGGSSNSPLTITSLATTVVKSPNVTMRITNMNGQPVASATVGDRLALLFEIKEKTSPFGIFVREIIAMDGRQVQQQLASNNDGGRGGYHYGQANNNSFISENSLESIQVNSGNSIQFIDSQGCPTDANIMGPLVKMDPNGHRVLAPFDAFKFPTSDMVFFRAVVSSCIAECKPVLCSNSGDQQESSSSSSSSSITPLPSTTKRTTSIAHLASSTVAPTILHRHQHQQHHHHHHGDSESPTNMATTSRRNNADSVASGRFTTTIPPSAPIQTNRPLTAATPNLDLIYTTLSDMSDLSLPLTKQQTNDSDQRLPSSTSGVVFSTAAPINQSSEQQQMWDQNPLDLGQSSSNISMTTAATNSSSDHKPAKQSSENSQKMHQVIAGGDSLTTVPGFSQHTNTAVSDANNQQQQLVVNMTNNHQLGKAPPRPTIPPSMGDKTIGPPIDLKKLTQEQKQQLVKLFESKLKQPSERNNNGSISEMADFYTGFLTSIMMNGIEGSDSNLAEKRQQQEQAEQQHQHQQAHSTSGSQQIFENNYLRNEKLAQLLGEFKPASSSENRDINLRPVELESLLSPYILRLHLNKTIELVAAEITRLLHKQAAAPLANNRNDQQSQEAANLHSLIKPSQSDILNLVTTNINNMSDISNSLTKQNSGNYYNDLATQATSINSTPVLLSPQLTTAQQSLDSNKSSAKPSTNSNRLKTRSQPVGQMNNKASLQGANKMTSVTKVSGQQETTNEINATAAATASAQLAKQQAKKANLQALADSYLGAYQPLLGGRRKNKRRRRRSIEEADDSTLSSGYVYLEQAQGATLAPSLARYNNAEARFTQGIVEMFHTHGGSGGRVHTTPRQRSITKRDVQPFYDIDELVVQSIKIVDRLQFPDEDQSNSADGRVKSSSKSNGSATANKFKHRSQSTKSNLTSANSHNNYRDTPDTAGLHDFEEEPDKLEEGHKLRLISLSSSGAISLIIVTLSFVFVQIFLVIICLMDWNFHKTSTKRRNFARSSQDLTSIDYSSTISNIGSCRPSLLSRNNSASALFICTSDAYARSGTFGSSYSSSNNRSDCNTYNTYLDRYYSTPRRLTDVKKWQTNQSVHVP